MSAESSAPKPMGPPPIPYPDNFQNMTPDDKYEVFKGLMLSTENKFFASPEIEETYKRRLKRWFDIIELKEPDRVPNYFIGGGFIADYGGITQADTFYDPQKLAQATLKCQEEFESDFSFMSLSMPGKAYEILGINMMRWPGGSRPDALPDNTPFQYVEEEYMMADEYDELINNPESYLFSKWYPKVFENLKGLKKLPSFLTAIEPATVPMMLMPFAMGPVREAIDTLLKAADSLMPVMGPGIMAGMQIMSQYGAPSVMGGMSKAPFDIIGDTMRGTRGVLMDMYREPDKLIAACDAVTPSAIKMAVDSAMMTGVPFIMIPLHKGADAFMSEEQFAKFYWPSFKRLLEELINAGLVPMPFVEGSYNNRLDIIAGSDLPKGKVVWGFDQTDMKSAKAKLGGKACIGGNVPSSIFATGTPDDMDKYCREVIETCAPGGGYYLAPGAVIDKSTPENVRTFFESVKKYGVY